ncbi:MAG: hypothetical protein K2Z81_21865 [Cyanobacteria bacterium]|nr:hypothetical protein [Cyanobacteriota bacterium]
MLVSAGIFCHAAEAKAVDIYDPPEEQAGAKNTEKKDEPFHLRAERNHLDEVPTVAPGNTRLARPAGTPPLAPPLAPPRLDLRTGASSDSLSSGTSTGGLRAGLDKSSFLLNAEQMGVFGRPQTPIADPTRNFAPLRGKAAVQLLSDFDVELIVDKSLSMRRMDCPGGYSRWDWCGVQARELADQLTPLVPRGFTLTTFSNDYRVMENAGPRNVAQLFQNTALGWGTRMSRPLNDRLDNYFRNRQPGSKPRLIAIITDGVPAPREEPFLVANTLINASHQLRSPGELTVVFFQVGGADRKGQWFVSEMDHNLVNHGASCDFVRAVGFDQLVRVGLAEALANSIRDFASQHQKLQR